MREGWQEKLLNELINVQSGFAFKSQEYTESGHFLIRIGNVQDGYLSLDNPKYVALDTKTARFELRDGDLLTSLTGNIGRVARVEACHLPAALNQRVARLSLRKNSGIESRFLEYFLMSNTFRRALSSKGHGAAQQNVSPATIGLIKAHIPPPPEQKRIVAILDEAFEGIDRAIANTEKNLANAREVFESYLTAVFSQQRDGCIEGKLGEVGGDVFTGPFGSILHKSDYVLGGIPLVNPTNIVGGKIIHDAEKTVSSNSMERLGSYRLKRHDVVIGRRGEIGRCAVVTAVEDGWLCGTGCFFIRVFKNVNPFFLTHLLRSRPYRRNLESLSSGATMLNLSNSSLSDLPIELPSRSEQENILYRLDILASQVASLEILYNSKLDKLTELKQSILAKAFAGELTTLPEKALNEAAQ